MKNVILFLTVMVFGFSLHAGTLQKKASSFFGGDTTNNTFNIGDKDDGESKLPKDSPGVNESIWNLDLYGMDFNLPHQPAPEQFLAQLTGFGITYKFNEHTHLWGRYSTFEVDGVTLEEVDTSWKHTHYIVGYGFRFSFDTNKRIVLNLGLSNSTVEETKELGEIGDLETGIALDTKYIWVDNNISYGLMLSFVQVGSKATTWKDHHKGGYASVGATAQIGLPNFF